MSHSTTQLTRAHVIDKTGETVRNGESIVTSMSEQKQRRAISAISAISSVELQAAVELLEDESVMLENTKLFITSKGC
jgi:hypothetical protein